MPIYRYRCESCKHEHEDYQHMKEDAWTQCPACGGTDYRRVPCLPHVEQQFHKPIEMYSIALNTRKEIDAFRRACPDVAISDDPSNPLYGIPIAATRSQKLAALDARGFTERN